MHLTFHGATREVTGSFHTITTENDRIVLDCGLFQGKRKEAEVKNRVLPVDPEGITNIILSHAHLDHSGRIPLVAKNGFGGSVFCTRATSRACDYLLLDSANIQEGDARYLNYKTARNFMAKMKTGGRKNGISKSDMAEIKAVLKSGKTSLNNEHILKLLHEHQLEVIEPLYSIPEAEESLTRFHGVPYNYPATVGKKPYMYVL